MRHVAPRHSGVIGVEDKKLNGIPRTPTRSLPLRSDVWKSAPVSFPT
jgi:hypothetical protein